MTNIEFGDVLSRLASFDERVKKLERVVDELLLRTAAMNYRLNVRSE